MKLILAIISPDTLDNGEKYLLRTSHTKGHDPGYIPVRFVGYYSCPAWVFVRNNDGKLLRIPREDVFTYEITDYT